LREAEDIAVESMITRLTLERVQDDAAILFQNNLILLICQGKRHLQNWEAVGDLGFAMCDMGY